MTVYYCTCRTPSTVPPEALALSLSTQEALAYYLASQVLATRPFAE